MSNGLDCNHDGLQKILLIGSINGLFYISLDTNDFIAQIVRIDEDNYKNSTNDYNFEHHLVNKKQQKFFNVDYYPIDSKIYWIDRETQSIKRCRLNGSDYEVFFYFLFYLIF